MIGTRIYERSNAGDSQHMSLWLTTDGGGVFVTHETPCAGPQQIRTSRAGVEQIDAEERYHYEVARVEAQFRDLAAFNHHADRGLWNEYERDWPRFELGDDRMVVGEIPTDWREPWEVAS